MADSSLTASSLAFLQRFGEFVGAVVLSALYFVLLGPVAVVARLATDPLRVRRPKGTAFLPWISGNDTETAARRQG